MTKYFSPKSELIRFYLLDELQPLHLWLCPALESSLSDTSSTNFYHLAYLGAFIGCVGFSIGKY